MNKLWAIIRREFLARVQTKAFIIGTILGPVILGVMVLLPFLLQQRDRECKRVAILDVGAERAGVLIEQALAASRRGRGTEATPRYCVRRIAASAQDESGRDSLLALIGLGEEAGDWLDGLLIVSDSALLTGQVTYLGSDVGSPSDMDRLEREIAPAILAARLERSGVDPGAVRDASQRIRMATVKVTEGKLTGVSGEASFALAYGMSFLLYLALLLYGLQVMNSVIEEKNNRIVEVLVSSVRPLQLLLGKIIGVGSAGLLQLAIWVGSTMLITSNLGLIARALDVPPESVGQAAVPVISPELLVVFLTFFFLGFFLYSAAYAAIGAMCNTTQEAQQSATVVTMFVAVGFLLVLSLLGDTNGPLARGLSLIPLFAPLVMPVRFSISPVPLTEVLVSILLTALGVIVVAWIASRIYRVGILSYGKRPNLRMLLRWVRTP
jgi:ABC-2 type transport system permease protein